jgi:hypothetical protein
MFGLFKKEKKQVDLGEPIIVVSGLPRSGTSMAMKMLTEAGFLPVQDGIREADPDNPKGYYEDERVKDLENNLDKSWLRDARGKVIKVISFLLKTLPAANHYKVIFMRRHLDEVLASQNKMLDRGGKANPTADQEMKQMYLEHLKEVESLVAKHPTLELLEVEHRGMIENPLGEATKINEFLGGHLDVEKMASVVDPNLYRNRAQ